MEDSYLIYNLPLLLKATSVIALFYHLLHLGLAYLKISKIYMMALW